MLTCRDKICMFVYTCSCSLLSPCSSLLLFPKVLRRIYHRFSNFPLWDCTSFWLFPRVPIHLGSAYRVVQFLKVHIGTWLFQLNYVVSGTHLLRNYFHCWQEVPCHWWRWRRYLRPLIQRISLSKTLSYFLAHWQQLLSAPMPNLKSEAPSACRFILGS